MDLRQQNGDWNGAQHVDYIHDGICGQQRTRPRNEVAKCADGIYHVFLRWFDSYVYFVYEYPPDSHLLGHGASLWVKHHLLHYHA